MTESSEVFWRKCSTCKKPIAFGAKYYICNVSTCQNPRTGYVFCSVACFDSHVPGARHKNAYALEEMAPKGHQGNVGVPSPAPAPTRAPARIIPKTAGSSQLVSANSQVGGSTDEVLVIASRLKDYITAKSGYNTSASVMNVLSDHLRVITDRAIDVARAEGRKTVLDRDYDFLKGRK